MNERKKTNTVDESRFDLLVDGELTAAEYEALLAELDTQPALWRACALAFLESQAWRSEMTAIRKGQEIAAAKPAAGSAFLPWRRVLPLLAIAASFVLAFFGGLAVQRQIDRAARERGMAGGPADSPSDMLAGGGASGGVKSQWQAKDRTSLGNIRLVVDGGQGNQPQQIDVPVYDGSQMGAEWLTQERPLLPEDVIESLARRGRKVERQIEYLPLPLDDQHQIVVPVEQIQITPVSRRSY